MAGGKHAGWHPGNLLRPCRANAMAAAQRCQQGVRNSVCPAGGTPCRRRQVVPCDPALVGAQQALHPEVRGLCRDPNAGDAVRRDGQLLGESDTRMWRTLFANVKAAHARLSLGNLVWLGADEINRRNGHNYLTVFTYLVVAVGTDEKAQKS